MLYIHIIGNAELGVLCEYAVSGNTSGRLMTPGTVRRFYKLIE